MKNIQRQLLTPFTLLILLVLLISSALIVSPVSAATITVTTIHDIDASDGECSLREAIIAANLGGDYLDCKGGTAGPDTIVLEGETYTLTGGQLPLIESEIIILGAGSASTIIQPADCDPTDDDNKCPQTDRILYVNAGPGSAGTGDLTLDGVTLRYGNPHHEIPGGGIAYDYGGAIYNKGWLTLTDTIIESNRGYQGGGIYNHSYFNEGVRISTSTIQNNLAESDGGGIYNLNGGITLAGSRVGKNLSGGYGGGVYNLSILNLVNSDIENNLSKFSGGGLFNATDTISPSELTIVGSTISGNQTQTGHGGGIGNNSQLTISGSEISGNTVAGLYYGGGIYNELDAHLDITTSLIKLNEALSGGGLYNKSSAGDGVHITDSTFSENIAGGGGGIFNDVAGSIYLRGTTVANNDVKEGWGGGIINYYRLVAVNSTISTNKATMGGGIYNYNAGLHLTNCTIYGNTGNGINNVLGDLEIYNTLMVASTPADCGSYGDAIGHNNLVARNAEDYECYLPNYLFDPLVDENLADNGGPTLTHALLAGSPAIDAGDWAKCPATDQRGIPRPQDYGCDIGAFELEGTMYEYTLTVHLNPEIGGTVSVSLLTPRYYHGDEVMLTAHPAPNYVFDSWSGDATGTVNPLTVTMLSDTYITANFLLNKSNIFLPLILR